MQNRALMEENARSRAFIERLLRHQACRGAFVRRIPALWQMFEHNPLILLRKIAKKENEMTDAALISNESRAHQVQSQKYPQIMKEINTTKEVIAYALQSSLHF